MSATTPVRPSSGAPAHRLRTHVRATVVLLVLTLLVTGGIYPIVLTEIAHVLDPAAAGGSLLRYPNGTVVGSSLVGQNLSDPKEPWLFWGRPSLTDYDTTLGADTPPGPTDPALRSLLSEYENYSVQYGKFNTTAGIPLWYLAPSASSIDPDLVPEAVLVQVMRVSLATNLTIKFLTDFVNDHITEPILPGVGVPYVNVLELDLALLPIIGK